MIVLSAFLAGACSNKKNTFTRRAYHNLTAHYNAWWNGNESLKEVVEGLDKSVPDNYTGILPVNKLGTKKDVTGILPKADRAIEKASMVIQRHSMFFNKKEHNNWIDDSYLMIGKAYFYKHEYQSARRTFEFILAKYKDSPLTGETMLWLANTYNQLNNFSRADVELEKYKSHIKKNIPSRKQNLMWNKVMADFFLRQSKNEFALPHLKNAVQLSRSKSEKSRLIFIQAQIHQSANNLAQARELYRQVVKKNPRYDMVFNAQINMARCFESESTDGKSIIKTLEDMLSDSKNKGYRDQIYYALSEIYIKEKKSDEAIKNLRASVAASKTNEFQKAQSSLALADILFLKPEYPLAQAYYDTALQATPKESKGYEELHQKTKILTDLVKNLVTIQHEDSLQKLARMPEAERNKVIDALIEKILEEERKKAEQERMRQSDLMALGQQTREMQMDNKGGGWYFYNPQAMSFGFSEFKKKWGDRRLEDLWRLSNKQLIEYGSMDDDLMAQTDTIAGDSLLAKRSTDPKKRETYLQSLPLTPKDIENSNRRIKDATFNAGFIYKEGLKDLKNAAVSFEQNVERFPDTAFNKNYLLACYQLVITHEKLGNTEKADLYRNILINGYPESDYARILIDPGYNEQIEKRNKQAEILYQQSYLAYKEGQYYITIMNAEQAVEKFKKHEILPRFALLKALAIGKIDVADSLVANLQRVVKKYPSTPSAVKAQQMLDGLANTRPALAEKHKIETTPVGTPSDKQIPNPYKPGADQIHFYLMVCNQNSVDINALKIKLSDFNQKYHKTTALNISGMILDDQWQIVNVGIFNNKEKSMDYYESIIESTYIFTGLSKDSYQAFVISQPNFQTLFQGKDVKSYVEFFERQYLGQKEKPKKP